MQKKRDNAYFLERLRAEHPEHWERYTAGGYASVRAALLDAGLLKQRYVLPRLKTLWKQADFSERAEFLTYLQWHGQLIQPYRQISASMHDGADETALQVDNRDGWYQLPLFRRNPLPLRADDRVKIIEIMKTRGWISRDGTYHVGEVMRELEKSVKPKIPELAQERFRPTDPSLSGALKVNTKLRPALLVALDAWLKADRNQIGISEGARIRAPEIQQIEHR